MADEQRKARGSVGDEVREGIRAGLGILSALKDAVGRGTFTGTYERAG